MSDLERFVLAQEDSYAGYIQALTEMEEGRKVGHLIWYIFPQLKGMGRSHNSDYYGIESLDEARDYLAYEGLGENMREISRMLLRHKDEEIEVIMGGRTDAVKLRSSMTLFDLASPGDEFGEVLDAFYGGKRDPRTLRLLGLGPGGTNTH